MAASTPAPAPTTLGIMAWIQDSGKNWLYSDVNAYFDRNNGRPAGHASFGLVNADGGYLWTFQSGLLTDYAPGLDTAYLVGVGSLWDATSGISKPASFEIHVDVGNKLTVSIYTGQGPARKTFYQATGTVTPANLSIH